MDKDSILKARRRLIETIADEARDTASWTGRREFSKAVMKAMDKVERHLFVLAEDRDYAYVNRPRGIGYGQTISQPYIVALMTDLLDLKGGETVLEIGAGSGYQAAVLAEIAGLVYTVEAVEGLAKRAVKRLHGLGYENVQVRHGDGFNGWSEHAPYDAIMVTAAPESIPEKLIEQLKPGGLMVIPIGRVHETQTLYRGSKNLDGGFKAHKILPVAFVPMVAGKKGGNN
ncbi:MAG: protein-L-isoaspartate(D-aspartate) O-methyltransferase [Rhodospirillales bacterium]